MTAIAKYPAFPITATTHAKPIFNHLIDEFLGQGLGRFVGSDELQSIPAVNVAESKDAFQVEIAAPGLAKENFTVNVDGNQLVIKAVSETKTETGDSRYTRREFRYGTFQRSFTLPNTVNQNEIGAVYSNGILNVTVPKKEESKPVVRSVEIAG